MDESIEYRVTWEIDITAKSPQEAARLAHNIQLDPSSIATAYVVLDPSGSKYRIDLEEDDWTRLSIAESHTVYCEGCGELADWRNDVRRAYCNACASELGAPDAYPVT